MTKIKQEYLAKIDEYVANTDKEDTLRIIEEVEAMIATEKAEEAPKSVQFNFRVLTKEEIENSRCKAYDYLI